MQHAQEQFLEPVLLGGAEVFDGRDLRLLALGVSTEAIAEIPRVATPGDYEQLPPKLNLSQRQAPIVAWLPDDVAQDMLLRQHLTVRVQPGGGSSSRGRRRTDTCLIRNPSASSTVYSNWLCCSVSPCLGR